MAAKQDQLEQARRVKDHVKSLLADHEAVNGVGITRVDGRYAVRVNLKSDSDTDLGLPDSIDGVPLVLKCVGRIRKQSA